MCAKADVVPITPVDIEVSGGTLASPVFSRHDDDTGSIHTNSTGDDGAADAAASAVLDLTLIRSRSSMPASAVEAAPADDDGDGPGTGQATPAEQQQPAPDTENRLSQVASALRRPSLSRLGSTRRLSLRRPSSSVPRSRRGSTDVPDALPTDCRRSTSPLSSDAGSPHVQP
eukprot:TRINITY_DN10807_c1_g1_i1.p1 TRINITY_DN10807_c1_g1~~TRINITY_DN10807_c1_g1_i1.p1  ORF type:complete len:172 (+),score=44.63 TRINITY_DN10807_c1_g1_i1:64-579(+)